MTSTVAGPVSVGAPRTALLSALFALGACGGDPPTPAPAAGGSGAGQAGTGIAQSGASGSGVMLGGGSGGMGSAAGGAGGGGAGGTSGGSAGMANGGSGGTTAGTNGTSGASGTSGTSGAAGVSGMSGGGTSGMGATGGMAGGPPSMGGTSAGSANSSGGAGGRALSFEADIWPVFEKIRDPVFVYYGTGAYESCATGGVCHGGDDPGAGLSMATRETAYEMLMDQPSNSVLCGTTLRVVAGAPEDSCLIVFYEVRLRDELEWVDTAEIDLVREWIAQGALP